MAKTRKVTITPPVELLESMKAHTDNVSGYLTGLAGSSGCNRDLKVGGLPHPWRPGTSPSKSILIANGVVVRNSCRWIPIGAYDRVGPSSS